MSRALALIRFNKTGNIYMGAYLGVTDTCYCIICTPEECWNEEFNCYDPITYLENYSRNAEKLPTDMWEDIEIYSDYGGGFYWKGKGSESLKVITSGYDFDEDVHDYEDGSPEWVSAFWETNTKNMKTCETCKHLRCFNEGYYCNHNLVCIRGYIYHEKPKFTNCEFWEWESLSSQGSERNETNTNRTSDM